MDDTPIDFCALEKELHGNIRAEERYWQQNDAKFRAVEQNVNTYEEFRQMVLAAHLKPLDKRDTIENPSGKFVIWNTVAGMKISTSNKLPYKPEIETVQTDNEKLPTTTGEFLKQWKCSNREDRLKLLTKFQPHHFRNLFDVDIPMGMLNDIFELFIPIDISQSDVSSIITILDALSKSKRFHLNLQFLSSSEKNSGRELFNKLSNSYQNWKEELAEEGITEETIFKLRNIYKA